MNANDGTVSSTILRLRFLFATFAACWTLLLWGLLQWDMSLARELAKEYAIYDARNRIARDQSVRMWATSHGGVYVPVTEKTQPNKYLLEANVKERDITTPSGRNLTLMNPAYILRQLGQDFSKGFGSTGHLTSLKPLNPDNAPDPWEEAALRAFEMGATEANEFSEIDGKPVVRLMQPFKVEKGCLKCHEAQGYKLGDIRGGISTTVFLDPIMEKEKERAKRDTESHILVWVIGLVGLFLGYGYTYRQERKRELLSVHQSRLSAAIEQTGEGVVITDNRGTILYANPAFASITGYDEKELLGQNPRIFKTGRHDDAFYHDLWGTILAGKVWRGRFVNKRKDGSLFEDESVITPITDITGKVVNFVSVKRDITREAAFSRAKRYFTAITSHELRTPLTKLQLARTLLKSGTESGLIEKMLAETQNDLGRISTATTVLADLSEHGSQRSHETLNLHAVLVAAVESTRVLADKKGRHVILDFDGSNTPLDVWFKGNRFLLSIALEELLSNAVKFSNDWTRITVFGKVQEDKIVITVEDQGRGIPKELLESVYEPYFSLEDPVHHFSDRYAKEGGGIGLGLTLARLIVEQHQGEITVASGSGGLGTRVSLGFPLVKTGSSA